MKRIRWAIALAFGGLLAAVLFGCALFNSPPVVNFTVVPATGEAPLLVSYDASTTVDPDGDPLTYAWTFGDGATGTAVSGYHTYAAPGVYEIRLVVTDIYGDFATMTRSVLVTAPTGGQPTASFTATPTTGTAPLSVAFNGSASSDPDGTIVAYGWNFGDGGTATGPNAVHTFASAGAYLVTLTVEDNDGLTATESMAILVTEPGNQLPVASFTADPTGSFFVPVTIDFDASASHDPDGTIIAYAWNFGDGDTATGETVSHEYTSFGTYTVILTVYDDDGAPASAVQDVVLKPFIIILDD
jgi:PKD repeat protein